MINSDNKKIEITKAQAEEILDAGSPRDFHWSNVPVRCNHCRIFGPIKNMKVEKYSLNDLNDVIVEGKCSNCGGRIARYFETGDVEASRKIAKKVWEKNND